MQRVFLCSYFTTVKTVSRYISMKVYEAVFKEDETQGVYALSVVENPAMEDMWITLSEQPKEIQLSTVDEEKRLLLGAALIPNKKIYRNVNEHEFYITFTEDTIEKVAHNFFKKGNQNNSSLEHSVKLEGMSVVEAWIVEDPNNDKSNKYGKTYEKGTWVTMMKVDNDDVWSKAKNGEIKGFSIDALLGLKEVNLKSDINMTKQDFLDAFKALFTVEKEVVKEEVKAEEIEVVAEEVVKTEEPQLETADVMMAITELKSHFDKEIEEVKVEFSKQKEELVKENEDLKVELSKQPEAAPIKAKGESVKSFEDMTPLERYRASKL